MGLGPSNETAESNNSSAEIPFVMYDRRSITLSVLSSCLAALTFGSLRLYLSFLFSIDLITGLFTRTAAGERLPLTLVLEITW
jgi:hypothetical protein